MANGDRIPMAPNCKIIFEPHNIDNASPATVSRNGMVYMSSSCLDYVPLVRGWLTRERNAAEMDTIMAMYDTSFAHLYRFFATSLHAKMQVLECMLVAQSCKLLQGLLPPPREAKEALPRQHLAKLYTFALMWSLGAMLELDDRRKLQDEMLLNERHLQLDLPSMTPPPITTNANTNTTTTSTKTTTTTTPAAAAVAAATSGHSNMEDSIFDYFVNERGEWTHWSQRVQEYVYPSDHTPEYSSILVPNVDNIRTDFLIRTLAKQNKAMPKLRLYVEYKLIF